MERERAAVEAARRQLEEARAAAAAAAATAANEALVKSRQETEQQAQLAEARRERERLQSELQESQQRISSPLPDVPTDCIVGSSPTLKENFFPVQVSLDIRCTHNYSLSDIHLTPSLFAAARALL